MSALPISLRRVDPSGSSQRHQPDPVKVTNTAARSIPDSISFRSSAAQPAATIPIREPGHAGAAAARAATRQASLVSDLLAHIPAADRAAAKTAIPAILDAARKAGSSDPNQIAYLLATAQTESDFGANMVETGHSQQWFNRNYGCEDGNRPGTNDGYLFRGRGYVQTTHAGRYAELSRHLGLPDVPMVVDGKPLLDDCGRAKMEPALVAHPEKLRDPQLAARALVIGVKQNLFTHNTAAAIDKTIPAGREPGDADFYHARAIVNGIVRTQAHAVAAHATLYAQILSGYRHSVLGVPEST